MAVLTNDQNVPVNELRRHMVIGTLAIHLGHKLKTFNIHLTYRLMKYIHTYTHTLTDCSDPPPLPDETNCSY